MTKKDEFFKFFQQKVKNFSVKYKLFIIKINYLSKPAQQNGNSIPSRLDDRSIDHSTILYRIEAFHSPFRTFLSRSRRDGCVVHQHESLTAPGLGAFLSLDVFWVRKRHDAQSTVAHRSGTRHNRFKGKVLLLLLDNYDSFTYNLFHYLGELGADVVVHRHDALTVEDALELKPEAIVISPGPCTPDKAGISLDLVRAAAGVCPILGVCLGHQTIAQAFGGNVVRAPVLMHGKISPVQHEGSGLFEDIPSPFEATRYHSLIAEASSLPDCLEVTARTDDGVIMGLQHRDLPIFGVQFHPESIETRHGHRLLRNFLSQLPTAGRA